MTTEENRSQKENNPLQEDTTKQIEDNKSEVTESTVTQEIKDNKESAESKEAKDNKEPQQILEEKKEEQKEEKMKEEPKEEPKKEEPKEEPKKDENKEEPKDEKKEKEQKDIPQTQNSEEAKNNPQSTDPENNPNPQSNDPNSQNKNTEDVIMENQTEEPKIDKVQNQANEIPSDIKTTDLTDMQEYKLYYNYIDLYMVRVAKYLDKEIILLGNEVKNEEPNFFFQTHYNIDDLIKVSEIFNNYKEDNKLYEFFINSFDNNNVKLSKDVNENSYIKLMIKVIQPDGDNTNFMLQLFRKERDYNPEFYDTYINVTRQLEKEQEKKRYLNSYEEDKDYNHHGINYNHSVLEEYSKIKVPGQVIDPEVENMENNKKRRKTPKKKQVSTGDEGLDLLNQFNAKYRLNMTLQEKQIDLYDKGLVTDDVNKLCKIKFENVSILYLNNNKIINIDALSYSTFHTLKILRLQNNVIAKLGKLGTCSFLSQLQELYLYNNKLVTLDEFSGIDFSELRILHISNNCLTNVDGLGYCKFKNLTQLLLYDNQITQIDTLGNCDFSKLKVLSIYYNKLTNVNSLAKTDLGNLNEMILNRNKINTVEAFPKMNLQNLRLLALHYNAIANIEPLTRCNFFEIKNCIMYCNKISKVSAKNQKAVTDMKARYPKLSFLRI